MAFLLTFKKRDEREGIVLLKKLTYDEREIY